MQNINELIAEMADVERGLRAGAITPAAARKRVAAAGKIISAFKKQLIEAKKAGGSPAPC